ncbi:type II toxin-antitoxin system HipA family toxin [Desulfurispirillum indicum]|uniref:type II toxin-antitoxin system HipA family toxin n=1 Tax=Desulfurispirillum indicum TaxID=936456 RepID=UPI001CF97596|nr:type II toxin-antitoxin system HipA family toxin [Desulfurispirillum indicum]UCZ56510.1 type II toxin-antitoxin system HipA family toxin [Desulfurispirillum indicum]
MTSEMDREAYVWIWLPGETTPVVAGRLERDGRRLLFNYGRSYLERMNDVPRAISIYEPELPLRSGIIPPLAGLQVASSIRDAAPDAWGRRVIINKELGLRQTEIDTAELDELTYLLESGSDRIGALDFQRSPTEYVPRAAENVSMVELVESAERVEKGVPLTPELDQALFHGSSIGGARPKAAVEAKGKKYIAKFSSSSDLYDVVKGEFIAMRLATLSGLRVAPVSLEAVAKKDVLLVERFDRSFTERGWQRHAMVSALTLLELDDMMARYASYETLAELIRRRFARPRETLRELFSRLVFNVLCGNTDDHARNHAAFWDGDQLSLTPAYDICPQGRTGNEASQAMLIHGNSNLSQLKTCLEAAHHFLIDQDEARTICEEMMMAIETHWQSVCDEAKLGTAGQNLLWTRQFLNPFSVVMD